MADPFDRVMRAAARRGRSVGVCPDADVLAAYLDNGLSSDERATVEAHAADCLRCQQHLALVGAVSVERGDPEEPRPWFVRWGWLVPVATAVLVVAVWIRSPDPRPAEQARQEAPATAVEPAPPPPAAAGEEGQRAASPAPERFVPSPPRDDRAAPSRPAAKAEARRSRDLAAKLPATAAPPAAVAEADRVGQLSDAARAPAEAEAKESTAGAAARQETVLLRKAAAPPALQADAAGSERYRASGGRIERSADGTIWHEAFADPSLTFTAAACAPGGPCWFGTSTGVVVRTSPSGVLRSQLPEQTPITAIAARSALEAVVTAGSRRYRTTDGVSWVMTP